MVSDGLNCGLERIGIPVGINACLSDAANSPTSPDTWKGVPSPTSLSRYCGIATSYSTIDSPLFGANLT